MNSALSIDGARFWQSIQRSGEIGPGRPGGLCRLALTDADCEMRDLFVQWCEDAGCTVSVDQLGNLFARRAGSDNSLPPLLIGSHLDTQVNGGKYDGIVGVMAGLEVLRTLNDHRISTKRAIEVVAWTNEEGARFSPPMVASGCFAGVYELPWVLDRKDDDGKRLGDELQRLGYAGPDPVGSRAIDGYLELHIEQGPELHRLGVPVGIVTHGYAARGFLVEVKGETAHTGPWPMDKRRNALVGAAMLAVATNDIGWAHHATGGKATAARLVAWPNKPGILSDWAQFTGDVRHEDEATCQTMAAAFRSAVQDCAARARVDMAILDEWGWQRDLFDPDMVALLRNTALDLSVKSIDLPSQAGHDAYHLARVAPTAMIFTPCVDGITHNHREEALLDATVPGVNVLLHSAFARANR